MYYLNPTLYAAPPLQIKWGTKFSAGLGSAIICNGTGMWDVVRNKAWTPVAGTTSTIKSGLKLGPGVSGALGGNIPSTILGQSRATVMVAFTHRSYSGDGFLYLELGTQDPSFRLYIDGSNERIIFKHYNNSFGNINSASNLLKNGVTYVIVATYDSITQIKNLYLDGTLVATGSGGANGAFGSSESVIPYINYDTSTGNTSDAIHAVYVWKNRILSPTEAQEISANPFVILARPSLARQEFFTPSLVDLAFSDALAILDTPELQKINNYQFADSFDITDGISIQIPLELLAADSFELLDAAVVNILGFVELAVDDSIELSDAIMMQVAIELNLSETIVLTDLMVYNYGNLLVLQTEDSLFIYDSVRLSKTHRDALSEELELTDQVTVQLAMNLTFGDSFEITDEQLGMMAPTAINLTVGDSFSISDDAGVAVASSFASSLRRYLNDVPSPRS